VADDLSARIGVLTRREVEARLLAPLVKSLGEEFGHDRVLAVVRAGIAGIAREQGAELARRLGGNTLAHFAQSLSDWSRGGALDIDILEQTDTAFVFSVTRCRYAELYHWLGIAELGEALSCGRDFALIEGFNNAVTLRRTQTIMGGAPYCDFAYRMPSCP